MIEIRCILKKDYSLTFPQCVRDSTGDAALNKIFLIKSAAAVGDGPTEPTLSVILTDN
jgi:hypothetical protein